MTEIDSETIVGAFGRTVTDYPDEPALRYRKDSDWVTITWLEYGRRVGQVVGALEGYGITAGDRVAILSGNRPEWHIADLGILSHGNVTVPLYPTSSSEQISYLLGHSESRVCFVENNDLLAKVLSVRAELPQLEHIVVFAGDHEIGDAEVVSFDDLCLSGSDVLESEPNLAAECARQVKAEQLATLVYTSGTTGPPKAAMISHHNIIWTLKSTISMFRIEHRERFLSFLPLSHVAERMMSDFAPIVVGGDTWFAESIGTIGRDLQDCRPTIFFGVPRIWEKMRDVIVAKLSDADGPDGAILRRYLRSVESAAKSPQEFHRAPSFAPKISHRALDVLVGARIRAKLGLDQAHILVSGAAPIHPELLLFLNGVGLHVMELYGQTETCGPTTCNPPDDVRVGTVGKAIPGVTLLIADDGEVLVKGGNVCVGYFGDSKSTAALIDGEGWMHSGDTGSVDEDGYLTITGRKKDLIITAAGQNIAPQEIEMGLRRHELISEAVVIGEGRRYLTALITLDVDGTAHWARKRGKKIEPEILASDPDLMEEVGRFLEEENARRARVERVRGYRILPRNFTVTSDELTPTLKVKRNVVNRRYRELIDEMYEQSSRNG